jgi:hypothetical protein
MGELLCVREVFEAGASYKWYVETEGKKLSKIRQFRILDKTESDNIRSQMKEVAEKYKDQCPEIKQALYLQVISNMTPDLDLYPDSLRLMKEYKYNKKCGSEFGYISERIFEYGLGKD